MKALKIAIIAAMHLGLWMLFVDNLSIRDFCAGLTAVGLTTTAVIGATRLMQVKFRPTAWEIVQAWRIPWNAISGTIDVLIVLARQLLGGIPAPSIIAAVPFDVGGDDAHSAGRRALALTYNTITPNSIVLGPVRRGEGGDDPFGVDVVLFHRVRSGPVRQLAKNLGARP